MSVWGRFKYRSFEEHGTAQLHITLKEGVITVRHGFDYRKKDSRNDYVMIQVRAEDGSWDALIEAIRACGQLIPEEGEVTPSKLSGF